MMKRFSTLVVILAVVAGLVWWQRATVVPLVVRTVPSSTAILAMIPGLGAYAKPSEAGEKADGAAKATGGSRRSAGGPVPVVLARVETKTLPVTIDAVGTAQAAASIAIRPRIDSQVVTVDVAEGAKVKEGDLLFTLDDRVVRAQLAQLDAQIVKDRAQIGQANTDLTRAEDLLRRNAGNAVTRDTAETAVKIAEAQLASDEASRQATQTTLSYTVISAPVPGRIGSIPVKPGSTVRSGDSTPLATVNQVDPSVVSFAIPQNRIVELRDAMARAPVPVEVTVAGKTVAGAVDFIENAIDLTTGTITVKARVPNEAELLWPGAYVTVTVVLDGGEPQVAVPSAAVQLGQDGPYVFVVKDGKSELRQITVARSAGTDAVVTKGVGAGEDVVVEGQLRLVDGASVAVKPSAAAEDVPVPTAKKS